MSKSEKAAHQERYPHLKDWDSPRLAAAETQLKFSNVGNDPEVIEARKAIHAELGFRGMKIRP
jgi:hypothetical protein